MRNKGIGQECRLGDADRYASPPARSSRQPYLFAARDSSSSVRSVTSSVLNGADQSSAFRTYTQQQQQYSSSRSNNNKALDDTRSEGSYYSDDGSRFSDETNESERRRKRKCYVKVMVLYMVAAAIVFFTVLLWRMGYIFTGQQEGIKSSFQNSNAGHTGFDANGNMLCNGLATNCNRRANEIMYATVHNAMSSREDNFLAFNNLYPLEDALVAGFRGLTLDSCDCVRVGIQLCHGLCLAGFRRPIPTFQAIVDFLDQYPHEIVIIELQVMADSLGPLFEALEEVSGLSDLMYQHPGIQEPWPTLKELIGMNQRLLVFQHDGPDCEKSKCPPGVHNTYQYMFETPFGQRGVSELMDVDATCSVSRGWSNTSFVISNHFSNDDSGLPDYDIAAVVNTADVVQYRIDACLDRFERLGRDAINLLVVDFWNVGDVLEVVNTFNSELIPITDEPSAAPTALPTSSADNLVEDLLTTSAPTITPGTEAPTPVPNTAEPTGSSATSLPTSSANIDYDDFYEEEDSTIETTTSSPTASAFDDLGDPLDETTATPTASDTYYTTNSPTAFPTAFPTYDFYSPPTATPTSSMATEASFFYEPTATPTNEETEYFYEPTAMPTLTPTLDGEEADYFYDPTAAPTQIPLNVINGDFQEEEENVAAPEQEEEEDQFSSGHGVFVPEKDTPGMP